MAASGPPAIARSLLIVVTLALVVVILSVGRNRTDSEETPSIRMRISFFNMVISFLLRRHQAHACFGLQFVANATRRCASVGTRLPRSVDKIFCSRQELSDAVPCW